MKKLFAVPTENGKLCAHFGHCEKFTIVETENQKIVKEELLEPPVHQPGVYPQFLAQQGVSVIISGGMGQKAQQLFIQNNIEVCMGVSADSPIKLVEQYLNNQLQTGQNLCDH
ncbi:MAG: NifB/NifX family molybdenum-iron cluster-binding protein [Candidatus Marinimicrobia bacterium]|nr:NifB/NifX family molybdenum-iron cluster-binding protein [Candidatus Neomarinimicrobiota bacterium]